MTTTLGKGRTRRKQLGFEIGIALLIVGTIVLGALAWWSA